MTEDEKKIIEMSQEQKNLLAMANDPSKHYSPEFLSGVARSSSSDFYEALMIAVEKAGGDFVSIGKAANATLSIIPTTTQNGKIIQKKAVKRIKSMSAKDIWNTTFPPTKWIVDDLLPVGILTVAAKPKVGKSFLVMQMCDAVTSGKDFLGRKTNRAGTWYLNLESDYTETKERLRTLFGDEYDPPEGFVIYAFDDKTTPEEKAQFLEDGLCDQIEAELSARPDLKLIVIDVLQKVRKSAAVSSGTIYAKDYEEIGRLQDIAVSHGICITLVSHTTKETEDIRGALEHVSPTVWKLKQTDRNSFLLETKCRRRESEDLILSRDEHCIYTNMGTEKEIKDRQLLEEHPDDLVIKTINLVTKSEGKAWDARPKDLIDLVRANCGAAIDIDETSLGKKLSDHAPLLKFIDGIEFESKRTNRGMKYTFTPIK